MAGYVGDGEDEARCIAEAAVSGVGLDQLQSVGVSPEALAATSNFAELGVTFEDTAAVESALVDCGDGYLVLTLSQTERTDASEACADEHISDEIVARVLVQSLNGEAARRRGADRRRRLRRLRAGSRRRVAPPVSRRRRTV